MDRKVGRVGSEAGEARRQGAHEAGKTPAKNPCPPAQGQVPYELHACMGLNACACHDAPGTAPMAGMGQCATVNHVCHGEGECRGQGGCGYAGSEYEQSKPGDQSCSNNGSCAVPINESRVFSAGPYKGKSVWKRARAIFEARMYEAGIPFGPSPGDGWPDDVYPPYEATPPSDASTKQ